MKLKAEICITGEDGKGGKFTSKVQCDDKLVRDLKNYHSIDAEKEMIFCLTDDLTRQVREDIKSNKV